MMTPNRHYYDKRWYDNHQETIEALEKLKNLDGASRKLISDNLVEIIKQIKEVHREEPDPELSIGIQRVLGLYQVSKSRRWYDKNKEIAYALQTMATLPSEDFKNIMEGLSISI